MSCEETVWLSLPYIFLLTTCQFILQFKKMKDIMSMEKYYKEINSIAFLKLFRTEKSVKKRRTMGKSIITKWNVKASQAEKTKFLRTTLNIFLNSQLFSILLSRQIENVNILVRFSIRQQGNKIKAIWPCVTEGGHKPTRVTQH